MLSYRNSTRWLPAGTAIARSRELAARTGTSRPSGRSAFFGSGQDDVASRPELFRPDEIESAGEGAAAVLAARPAQLGDGIGDLREEEPPSRDLEAGHRARLRVRFSLLPQDPTAAVSAQQAGRLGRAGGAERLVGPPGVVAGGAGGIGVEYVPHEKGRARRGDQLLDLPPREPDDTRRQRRMRASGREHVELGQPGGDEDAPGSLQRPDQRGGARQGV